MKPSPLRSHVALVLLLVACPASAQFAATEVSGPSSSAPFLLSKASWSWEDIACVTYSVHRSLQPSTGFSCILDGARSNTWSGDPAMPGAGSCFYYVITAFDGTDDNSPGTWSDGTPRTITPCPRTFACPSGPPVAGRVPLRLRRFGTFTAPIFLTSPPGDCDRVFVLERAGRIRIQHADGTRALFLDITNLIPSTAGEKGALGLAFHPDYACNGKFYVHYSAAADATCTGDNCATISEFTVSADPDVADAASERILRRQPDYASNHNGGWLAFGPDGYLYAAFGDGGGQHDPNENGQDLATRLGKILRIDVDGRDAGLPYAIPPDNPFVSVPGARDEIWCLGVRNPWRDSFDRETGDLYIADVGQDSWEEIDVATAASGGGRGANYGWDDMEGAVCHEPLTGCLTAGRVLPDYVYPHSDGCSITGGYVYRGCRMPGWHGTYFFADYCGDWVDCFDYSAGIASSIQRIFPVGSVNNVFSFGEDAAGEIYVLEGGGTVWRIEPQ
jgi:glucose/arabinose dehydrogenase